jgi:hypothetical protein
MGGRLVRLLKLQFLILYTAVYHVVLTGKLFVNCSIGFRQLQSASSSDSFYRTKHLALYSQKGQQGGSFSRKDEQLRQQLQFLRHQICSILPSLEALQLPADKSPIPSSLSSGYLNGDDLQSWAECELDLRIGIGHDYLAELRHAVGLQHYLLRREKKSARGVKGMQKVSRQQASTARQKSSIISDYIRNWKRIARLLSSGLIHVQEGEDRLKGLQELNSKRDVQFFEEWGTQTSNYMGHRNVNVTWIWRVAMEGQPDAVILEGSSVKRLTDAWESEGQIQFAPAHFTEQYSARRLIWLHAFARNERWKEELLLVREELRRIGAWYQYQINLARTRALEAVAAAESIGNPGSNQFLRGYASLLWQKHHELYRRYSKLPAITWDGNEINPEHVVLEIKKDQA